MSSKSIALVWIGDALEPKWPLGPVHKCDPSPESVAGSMASAAVECDFVLTWDSAFGLPPCEFTEELCRLPGDCWHAGLALGMGGQPEIMDFIQPTWPLNADPPADIMATSWRISLRACLVRSHVITKLGGPMSEFSSIEMASLEMGHRWIMLGALIRHVTSWPGIPQNLPSSPHPLMVSRHSCKPSTGTKQSGDPRTSPPNPLQGTPFQPSAFSLQFSDSVRFAKKRFGRRWTQYGLLRAWMSGACSLRQVFQGFRLAQNLALPPDPPALDRGSEFAVAAPDPGAKVSVIIPTIERYPYLRTVLDQLRWQTIAPHEVFVIDQTPAADRDLSLEEEFADLPLAVIRLDEAGQCTARNAALLQATGSHFLFIDDDDEVEPNLIELHLKNLAARGAAVSCGVVDEPGALPLPPEFRRVRASDVFPTCNALASRTALERSGLFDLAYDRGQRADGDLGMRLYLSGALMVLDGSISAIHHHAPRGGLRVHKARVITYGSSRQTLGHRHIPSVSQLYLWRRYFTARQIRETLWMAMLGTLAGRGSVGFKLMKMALSLVMMPNSVRLLNRNRKLAEEMLRAYPQIPALDETRE